ncbi:hypothetical protein EPK97_17090 [Chengkuizengella sediminis]|nr:hypothetical protein [Chengkuizengella sediminis]
MAKSGEGYSLGLYNGQEIEPKRTFLTNESSFEKNVVFGNMTSKNKEFGLIVFDHYEQIEFEVEGNKYKTFNFSVNADEYSNIPIDLHDLDVGFHSINYIILESPNEVVTDINKINSINQSSRVYNIRVNILNGISHIPEKGKHIQSNEIIEIVEQKVTGIFINEVGKDYKILTSKTIQDSKENVDIKIIYGNQDDFIYDFYLVALNNWEQIPILDDSYYIYDEINPGKEKHLKTKITNLKYDENIFQVLMIPSPYIELPDSNPYVKANLDSSFRALFKK